MHCLLQFEKPFLCFVLFISPWHFVLRDIVYIISLSKKLLKREKNLLAELATLLTSSALQTEISLMFCS